MATTFKFGNGNWAVKEDLALAYNDENGNFKPLPFDFTRASTATRVNKDGLIENVPSGKPRIDFLDNTSGHLLLEPSRTNNITYSEDFTQSYWLVSSMTVTADDTTSPYGTQTAAKIEATGGGSVRTSSYTGTDGYAFSIFVKKGNSTYVTLRAFGFTTSAIIGFNLDTLTAQTGGVIEDYGNDWYRLSISKDISSDADKSGFFYIYLPDSLGSTTSVSGNYAYFFGAQLEDADYPTSYIPTEGSTVTRSAETCSQTPPSSVIGQTEGSAYFEYTCNGSDSSGQRIFVLRGSSTADRIAIFDQSGKIRIYVADGGGLQLDTTTNVDTVSTHKVAFRYKLNDFKLYIDGTAIVTDATFTVPTLNSVYVGTSEGFGGTLGGNVSDVKLYDTALNDSELQALTS